METLGTLIGGQITYGRDGGTIESINPADGRLLARFPRCTPLDVDDAVGAAAAAQPGWRALAPGERAAVVERIAVAVLEHAEELAGLDVADNGSPIREMRRDAHIAAAQLRYFAGLALQLRGETMPGTFDRLNYTLHRAVRGGRADRPVQPPADVRREPHRGAADRRQHRYAEALRAHLAVGARASASSSPTSCPPGVVNVVTGYGAGGRRRARHPSGRPADRLHRLRGDRPPHPAARRRRDRQDGDARARRQEPDRGVPRRRPRPGRRRRAARDELHLAGTVVRIDLAAAGARVSSTMRSSRRLAERIEALRSGPPDEETHRHRRDRAPWPIRQGARLPAHRPGGGRPRGRRRRSGADRGTWPRACSCRPTLFDGRDSRLAPGPGGDLRPGPGGDAVRRLRGGARDRQRRRVRADRERVHARPGHRATASPATSRPATCGSTTPRVTSPAPATAA